MSLSHAKSRATLLSPLDWGRQRRSTQMWQRNMVASSQCALGPGARGAVLTGRGAHPSRAGEPRLPRAGTLTPDGRTCRALSPFPRGFLLQVTGLHAAPPHPEGVYLLQVNSRAHRSTPSAGRGSGCQPPALWLQPPGHPGLDSVSAVLALLPPPPCAPRGGPAHPHQHGTGLVPESSPQSGGWRCPLRRGKLPGSHEAPGDPSLALPEAARGL